MVSSLTETCKMKRYNGKKLIYYHSARNESVDDRLHI